MDPVTGSPGEPGCAVTRVSLGSNIKVFPSSEAAVNGFGEKKIDLT